MVLYLFVSGARTARGAGEQEGQIRGRIVEASTGAPVPGATVTVSPGVARTGFPTGMTPPGHGPPDGT